MGEFEKLMADAHASGVRNQDLRCDACSLAAEGDGCNRCTGARDSGLQRKLPYAVRVESGTDVRVHRCNNHAGGRHVHPSSVVGDKAGENDRLVAHEAQRLREARVYFARRLQTSLGLTECHSSKLESHLGGSDRHSHVRRRRVQQ